MMKQKAREVTDAAASAKSSEENERITKQKAREVTNAAASAKNNEENDKIAKQKAREVTDAAASAKSSEENEKIMKQKAREVTDAAASAKNDEVNEKITKQKAREVTDAAASAKNDETNDKITKRKAREVTDAAASAEEDEENDKITKLNVSFSKERNAKGIKIDEEKEEINLMYEETSQKLVSEAQYGKELKDEFEGIKNAVASMKAKHKVDIDLRNTKIEELKKQIKTSNANNKVNEALNEKMDKISKQFDEKTLQAESLSKQLNKEASSFKRLFVMDEIDTAIDNINIGKVTESAECHSALGLIELEKDIPEGVDVADRDGNRCKQTWTQLWAGSVAPLYGRSLRTGLDPSSTFDRGWLGHVGRPPG